MYDLLRAGAFAKLMVWGDYGAWVLAVSATFIAAAYLAMVALPIYSETSTTADDVLIQQPGNTVNSYESWEKPGTPEELRKLC